MPTIKLTGVIHRIEEEQTKGNYTFKNLILSTDPGQYPNLLEIQWSGKNIGLLDVLQAGDSVDVDVNLRGKESNGKVWVSLAGWKICKTGHSNPVQEAPKDPIQNYKSKGAEYVETVPDSDIASELPF